MPGGFALEDGARVAIHPEGDGVESCLRDAGEIRALREEAADEAIGIFIAAASWQITAPAASDAQVYIIYWLKKSPVRATMQSELLPAPDVSRQKAGDGAVSVL